MKLNARLGWKQEVTQWQSRRNPAGKIQWQQQMLLTFSQNQAETKSRIRIATPGIRRRDGVGTRWSVRGRGRQAGRYKLDISVYVAADEHRVLGEGQSGTAGTAGRTAACRKHKERRHDAATACPAASEASS